MGGLTFGDASVLDLNHLHKEWYDWTMKGGPKPEFLKKRVAYYVPGAGAENWKYADSLEAISNETRKPLSAIPRRPREQRLPVRRTERQRTRLESPDRYVYDPLDTRPAAREQKDVIPTAHRPDWRAESFGNGLIYHSEAFAADTEITGYLKLVAWIALNVPDTDFAVEVDEIKADGSSVQLTSDLIRRDTAIRSRKRNWPSRARSTATSSAALRSSRAGLPRAAVYG